MKRTTFSLLALVLILPLAGCGRSQQNASPSAAGAQGTAAPGNAGSTAAPSVISGAISKGIDRAKQELANQDINVNSVHINGRRTSGDDSRPKAQITPQGDLLIAGKQVPATPDQHALLVDYRSQILGIADAGMDIGAEGADLGLHAAREALLGAFSGNRGKQIETAIKPQADRIKSAALALCKRLPDLLSSQQKLAAAMPAFRPYATMRQQDIDDCGKDHDGRKGFAVFSD